MKISFQWLCEYAPDLKKVDPFVLAKEFTLKSFEVEEVIDEEKAFENMVVGKIEKIRKHPNADKLLLVDTNIGKKKVQIVCGCTNLEVGQLVFVALPGAKVKWHGEGELIELQETEIRGEKSFGMICTSEEVGLKELIPQTHEREGLVLDKIVGLRHASTLPGTAISKALGFDDIIFDVDNKTLTNRPDLWGHIGLAREAAAILGKKFTPPTPPLIKGRAREGFGKEKFSVIIKDKKACLRYSGALVKNLEIAPSPFWMQKRLLSLGLRSINNLVDITNYVMLEIGQPMHAFDAEKLESKKIVVETIKEKKKFKALDNKEYELPENSIVITNGKNIEAIGGILGGASSEISSETKVCFFESANFDARFIRQTSMRLGIRTDASARHEKNLDPEYTLQGLYRAIELLKEFVPNIQIASQVDVYQKKSKSSPISLSHQYLEEKIGLKFQVNSVKQILEHLGCKVSLGGAKNHRTYKVHVPSFRATKDIQIAEDLIEEVARIYGYDKITSSLPDVSMIPPKKLPHLEFEQKVKTIFARDLGFSEIYLYAFEDEKILEYLGTPQENFVEIQNALQKELRYLKLDLISGLLRAVKKNEHEYSSGKIFEVSRVFHRTPKGEEGLPHEERRFAALIFNETDTLSELKGNLEVFYEKIGLGEKISFGKRENAPKFFSLKNASILLDGEVVGFFGNLNENLQNFFKIKKNVTIVELNLDALLKKQSEEKKYQPLPRFPSILLDVSVVVPRNFLWYTLRSEVQKVSPELIENIEIFDVFESESLGIEMKSVAFRITYRHAERTLSLEEVLPIHEKIIEILEQKVGAKVRK